MCSIFALVAKSVKSVYSSVNILIKGVNTVHRNQPSSVIFFSFVFIFVPCLCATLSSRNDPSHEPPPLWPLPVYT